MGRKKRNSFNGGMPQKHNTSNREFWESAVTNKMGFTQYYNRLTELSVSMFEWKNLPDTVDPRFLELVLFGDGMAVFFKDEVLGFLATRVMIGGSWNIYEIPNKRRAYAVNGYTNSDLNQDNSVMIFNNFLHTNSVLDVELFAKRLYNLDRIIDVNVNAQKTPIIVRANEKQRLTLKNLYMKYEGNEPFIFGDESLDLNSLEILKTDAPYVADDLYTLKTQIWNEALTYLGISNINVQKKERMITDEVTRNQGGTIASRYSRLEMRRQACKQINDMFGLNIQCDYREDFQEVDSEDLGFETEEEEENV